MSDKYDNTVISNQVTKDDLCNFENNLSNEINTLRENINSKSSDHSKIIKNDFDGIDKSFTEQKILFVIMGVMIVAINSVVIVLMYSLM